MKNTTTFVIPTIRVNASNEVVRKVIVYGLPTNIADVTTFQREQIAIAVRQGLRANDLAHKGYCEALDKLLDKKSKGHVSTEDFNLERAKIDAKLELCKEVGKEWNRYVSDLKWELPTSISRISEAIAYSYQPNIDITVSLEHDRMPSGSDEILDLFADVKRGKATKAELKKAIIAYAETLFHASEQEPDYSVFKNFACRITDEQVNELYSLFKGIEDKWNKKDISYKRMTGTKLISQVLLKVLKRSFKFSGTTTAKSERF